LAEAIQSIGNLAKMVAAELDTLDEETQVKLWVRLCEQRDIVKATVEEIDRRIAKRVGYGWIRSVDGVGVVAVTWSAPRKGWDNDSVIADAAEVLAKAVVDPDTGELLNPVSIKHVIYAFAELIGSPSWRMGDEKKGTPGIRRLGLNPDDYSTRAAGELRLSRP
jgi:hypothetical protein